jgi:hypothetical protein
VRDKPAGMSPALFELFRQKPDYSPTITAKLSGDPGRPLAIN